MVVPWKAVLSSRAFLAILVAHACSNWGWYMLLIELPFYMKQVLKFNMTEVRKLCPNIDLEIPFVNVSQGLFLIYIYLRIASSSGYIYACLPVLWYKKCFVPERRDNGSAIPISLDI